MAIALRRVAWLRRHNGTPSAARASRPRWCHARERATGSTAGFSWEEEAGGAAILHPQDSAKSHKKRTWIQHERAGREVCPSVTSVTGDVTITVDGIESPLTSGTSIPEGAVVKTGADGQVELTSGDR